MTTQIGCPRLQLVVALFGIVFAFVFSRFLVLNPLWVPEDWGHLDFLTSVLIQAASLPLWKLSLCPQIPSSPRDLASLINFFCV